MFLFPIFSLFLLFIKFSVGPVVFIFMCTYLSCALTTNMSVCVVVEDNLLLLLKLKEMLIYSIFLKEPCGGRK
jgi:uncharacterized paraquat-inducible protein A